VDNLVGQGRLDEAGELYESLCDRANSVAMCTSPLARGQPDR
jgi:hypothetical protein